MSAKTSNGARRASRAGTIRQFMALVYWPKMNKRLMLVLRHEITRGCIRKGLMGTSLESSGSVINNTDATRDLARRSIPLRRPGSQDQCQRFRLVRQRCAILWTESVTPYHSAPGHRFRLIRRAEPVDHGGANFLLFARGS